MVTPSSAICDLCHTTFYTASGENTTYLQKFELSCDVRRDPGDNENRFFVESMGRGWKNRTIVQNPGEELLDRIECREMYKYRK